MSMIKGLNRFVSKRLIGHGYSVTELLTGEIRVTRGGRLVASKAGRWSLEEWATRHARKYQTLCDAFASRDKPWRAAMKRSVAQGGSAIEIPHDDVAETCLLQLAQESICSVTAERFEDTFIGTDDGRAWCVVLVRKRSPMPAERSNVIPFRKRA